jgi:N-acetylmuramate 1-kinase
MLLKNEAETLAFAASLALAVSGEDVITLSGDLGAGKSTFARALIRALAGDDALEVPSPTYAILQSYDTPRMGVVHADLYRLKSADELYDIGWDEAANGALLLIEWPERLGDFLPQNYLNIHLETVPRGSREVRKITFTPHGTWQGRIERHLALQNFIDNAGMGEATRQFMQGDASSRRYERLFLKKQSYILMDAPPMSEASDYAKRAKIAQNMVPFVALSEGLRDAGFSAPEILAADLDQGFLLIEDLGGEGVVRNNEPIMQRYGVAVETLAHLHARQRPTQLPTPKGLYTIPPFDEAAMLAEIELLIEWYVPFKGGLVPASERIVFLNAWKPLLKEMAQMQETWVLRDYHSPNLLWLPEREGFEHIGLIDFQDALLGPCSYDLVSLTQDARITVSSAQEKQLLAHYIILRERMGGEFNRADFAASYAIMGAQRATKILGIFARLYKRDGKPAYLAHIPRVQDYLERNLAHPLLADVKTWIDARLPK